MWCLQIYVLENCERKVSFAAAECGAECGFPTAHVEYTQDKSSENVRVYAPVETLRGHARKEWYYVLTVCTTK